MADQGMADGNTDIFKSIFRYQSQHDTVIPPLKPIGQTFVKVDNQAKVVATKITIDSRSPAVSLNLKFRIKRLFQSLFREKFKRLHRC